MSISDPWPLVLLAVGLSTSSLLSNVFGLTHRWVTRVKERRNEFRTEAEEAKATREAVEFIRPRKVPLEEIVTFYLGHRMEVGTWVKMIKDAEEELGSPDKFAADFKRLQLEVKSILDKAESDARWLARRERGDDRPSENQRPRGRAPWRSTRDTPPPRLNLEDEDEDDEKPGGDSG